MSDPVPIRVKGRFAPGSPRPKNAGRKRGVRNYTTQELRQEYVSACERRGNPSGPKAASDFGQFLDTLSKERLADHVARIVLPKPREPDARSAPAGRVNEVVVTRIELQAIPEGMFLRPEEIARLRNQGQPRTASASDDRA